MNKTEAHLSLILITFLSAVQNPFLAGVPEDMSYFAFLCITNLVGFVIMLLFFFGELFRLDRKQIGQSVILSAELLGANTLILMGSALTDATVISCVTSAYFILIPLFSYQFFHQKPDKRVFPGIAVVVIGLFLMMDADASRLLEPGVLYLLGADVFIALYFLTLSRNASTSNPSIIAMGQMFFCALFALILWIGESAVNGVRMALPTGPRFWETVIYISFFIRGLYGIVQIYALRYIQPVNASLIFSSEIVITMGMSPVIARLFDMKPEQLTAFQIAGAVLILMGILLADESVYTRLIRLFSRGKPETQKKKAAPGPMLPRKPLPEEKRTALFSGDGLRPAAQRFLAAAVIYLVLDNLVQRTGFLRFGPTVGLKSFMPVTSGLFLGPAGVLGCCAGGALNGLLMGTAAPWIAAETAAGLITGLGMWLLWPLLSGSVEPALKRLRQYAAYVGLVLGLSLLSGGAARLIAGPEALWPVALGIAVMSLIPGIPIQILLHSMMRLEPAPRAGWKRPGDVSFTLTGDKMSLAAGNELIEACCMRRRIGMAKVFEVENCLEELYIRLCGELSEPDIRTEISFDDTVSLRLAYPGKSGNPFRLREGEDESGAAGLLLLRHRALRASFTRGRRNRKNTIHIVI